MSFAGVGAIEWRDNALDQKAYQFGQTQNQNILGGYANAMNNFNSTYGGDGWYAPSFTVGKYGIPTPSNVMRLETNADRTRSMLKGYLDKWGGSGGKGDKDKPELSAFDKFPTGPAVSDENLALMKNSMFNDSLAQAAGVNQRTADSFAARGMGNSPLIPYLQANTESQARGEGSRAGTQLGYQAGIQNAEFGLNNAKAQADSWNAYQQNLVGRYQAQNGLRNAILSAIGGLA